MAWQKRAGRKRIASSPRAAGRPSSAGRWLEMFGLHPAIDALYRKNVTTGDIEAASVAWEKEMFPEVEEVA
jgi:hypothetical protein